jgi:molecular chaperone DnaJ
MAEMDYYRVLGVAKNASQDDISKAFRKLAKKYHPDRNPGDKGAEKRFKELSAAHEVLGDAEKRQKYDQLRDAEARGFRTGDFGDFADFFRQAAGQQAHGRPGPQPGGGMGGFDFADIFSNLFRGGAGAATAAAQQGEDVLRKIDVPFLTAIEGGSTSVPVHRMESCSTCRGTGARPGSAAKACPTCGGRGTVQTAQGGFAFSRPCPDCLGRGKRVEHPCPACRGRGHVEHSRNISVKIPKGVRDGQKIRLSGEGMAGEHGGPPGDLYLQVHILPHPSLDREGNDIFSTVELNIAQATLGTTVPVKTLDGPVQLRIPPGTPSGARLRLRGRGMATRGGARGDHYVRVKIGTPKKLTDRQADLLRQFAREADLPT